MLTIDGKAKLPLYIQLYQQIKAEILDGVIGPGTKLKSSRETSAELGISRNTVELAYEQLLAEGLIASRPRSGYYAEAPETEAFRERESAGAGSEEVCESPRRDIRYDFQCGKLLSSELPCGLWHRLIGRCFHDYREELARQGSPLGEIGLRAEIQKQLRAERNVDCRAEQIVVTTGTQHCLSLICLLLKSMGRDSGVAMEEPGYDRARVTFQNNGLEVYPVTLDRHGPLVDSLGASGAAAPAPAALYTTPSHQFPTGVVMSAERRAALVEWAKAGDAFLIEDDYNCYYRHGARPLPSLQSLCADRVFYIGGFSDILFPCIGVAYLVVPENLLGRLRDRFQGHAPAVPFFTQKPLELFMREGHWESHLRKLRKRQKLKCEALTGALESRFGDRIRISGAEAGLHILIQAGWPAGEDELIRRAARAGVGVYPTRAHWHNPGKDEHGTVLLNYGGVELADIPTAAALLHRAWLGTE
jgi:GntR family transcriptional regulator/MocR family aminotransferase